jgi:hypothetical protein
VDFHRAIADRQVDRIIAQARQKVATQFNEIMPAITLFDKHWVGLGEPNKEAIWKYLTVLCVLCERAKGIPSDM